MLCSHFWAIRQVFGVAVCFKAPLRDDVLCAREGWERDSPGSGNPWLPGLVRHEHCMPPMALWQVPAAPEGQGLSSLSAEVGSKPPSCCRACWGPRSGCSTGSLTPGLPSLSNKNNAIHQPFKCLGTSSLSWLIGVISVVLHSLPFSLHMCILCADYFILQ